MKSHDIIIVGGGLAGWICALHLKKFGFKVKIIEKKAYPFHKFCGEYLSNEVLPYLQSLGISLHKLGANQISRFQLSDHTGEYVESLLPLGGMGIRRWTLDHHLCEVAKESGVEVVEKQEVQKVSFLDEMHHLTCKNQETYRARIVIGAFGKRSILDKQLNRKSFQQHSPYIGIKHYFSYDYPKNLVSLHNFEGGYCGMARMEDHSLNLCYLSKKEALNQQGGIDALEQEILCKNPLIRKVFQDGKKLLSRPLVISNISFRKKELIKDHVLMCGDAAGMIFPLCGNGMAMAIHAAKLLSESVIAFFQEKITREEMEKRYQNAWKSAFSRRLAWGRAMQNFMGSKVLSSGSRIALSAVPGLLPAIINKTHGKPIDGVSFRKITEPGTPG